MKKIGLILLLGTLLASCHRDRRPDGVLPPDQLAAFLTDAHLVESYYKLEANTLSDTVHQMLTATYDTLFLRHGFSRDEFDSSMAYYAGHEEELVAIYDQVILRLDSIARPYRQ